MRERCHYPGKFCINKTLLSLHLENMPHAKKWMLGRPLDIEKRIYVSITVVSYLQIRSVFLVLLIDSPLHK